MKRINESISIRGVNGQDTKLARTALAVAIGSALAGGAYAQTSENAIEVVEVYGQRDALYKAQRSGDSRRTADLAATPQTMTILTQSQIVDSGKTDLKEILASQAGITLGTGENGNAFGDRYIIRGHEARSDVFVDGVRDPGMTTRESFATEQIEITKGPSSTFAGRGSSGGAVNGITKQASLDYNFAIAEGGIGSDEYHRVTFDVNQPLSDTIALRANLLHADEQVPNREPAAKRRVGGLVSGIWEVTEQLGFVVDYYGLDADDVPDLGSYFDRTARRAVEGIPVYLQNSDFLDTEVDALTLKTSYAFDNAVRIQNTTRRGRTDNGYVTTGARGTTRHATDPDAPGAPTFSLSTHQGWQEVDYFVNQLNVSWDTDLWGMQHQLVFGTEYSDENVRNGVFNTQTAGEPNCILPGRRNRPPSGAYCGLDATGNPVPDIGMLMDRTITRGDRDSNFKVKTISASAMDTLTLNDMWTGFFGMRYDRFDYDNAVRRGGTVTDYAYTDGFWNGHAGLVRNIGDRGNVYLSVSTATNINGGESDVGGSCGYGGLCGTPDQVDRSDPEQVRNLELGTKWQLVDNRLLATAALFQMTKSDVMESVGDAYSSLGTLNTGKNRIEGIELSLAGAVTGSLSVQLSAAFMDSEVLEAFDAEDEGLALSNFADDSVYVQLRYQATEIFAIGGSYTYKSEMYGGQPDTAAGYSQSTGEYSIVVPPYRVVDLFMNYYPTDTINLRLNVSNVAGEEYWTAAYRSGSFMYLGDARSIRATLTWAF